MVKAGFLTLMVSIWSQSLPSSFHLPGGCWLNDPGAHGKHLFISDLSFQSWYLTLHTETPLSWAGHFGMWLMLSPNVVIRLIYLSFWGLRLSWIFSELAHSRFAPGWLVNFTQRCFISSRSPMFIYVGFLSHVLLHHVTLRWTSSHVCSICSLGK